MAWKRVSLGSLGDIVMTKKIVFLEMNHRAKTRLSVALCSALSLVAVSLVLSEPAATQGAGQGQHVELVGHNDLQGRESLQVTAKSDEANGDWVYVGHHDNTWDEDRTSQPDHQPNGVERNVDLECLRSSQSGIGLAYTEYG